MRYTSKKIAGLLFITLFIVVIGRLIPVWLWIAVISALTVGISYFVYIYFNG